MEAYLRTLSVALAASGESERTMAFKELLDHLLAIVSNKRLESTFRAALAALNEKGRTIVLLVRGGGCELVYVYCCVPTHTPPIPPTPNCRRCWASAPSRPP